MPIILKKVLWRENVSQGNVLGLIISSDFVMMPTKKYDPGLWSWLVCIMCTFEYRSHHQAKNRLFTTMCEYPLR